MANCVIFCAGEFHGLAEPICAEDFIIAADGGLKHCENLNITPDLILGDFDSLGHIPEKAAVYPTEKDDTDSMLAIRHGLEKGFARFILYGAMEGPRLDHTVANLQSLNFLADRGARGYLVGKTQIATVVKGEKLLFPDTAKGIVSVFCMGENAQGVTLKNLHYPMENGCLTAQFPLGVSNRFLGKAGEISAREGALLVIYHRQNGLL